ncbi:MAG: polyprenyl synthetase family protein, partial [Longicatena sp.]
SDDPHAQHADYKTIGNHVGMIFQLLDDVMDFEETERTAKKPVQSDFEQGVVTLPLIHAFDTYPELLEQVEKEPLSREAINSAVAKAGGVKYTQDCATNYYETAKERINKLEIQPDKRARLMGILNLSMRVQ